MCTPQSYRHFHLTSCSPPVQAAPSPEDGVTTVSDQETETESQNYVAELVDPSDPGPDMFVLAFQELDLSAEALIYSTGTAREDAWCVAVFAALGEKAVRYEKVCLCSLASNHGYGTAVNYFLWRS